jgi:hypothetical protein
MLFFNLQVAKQHFDNNLLDVIDHVDVAVAQNLEFWRRAELTAMLEALSTKSDEAKLEFLKGALDAGFADVQGGSDGECVCMSLCEKNMLMGVVMVDLADMQMGSFACSCLGCSWRKFADESCEEDAWCRVVVYMMCYVCILCIVCCQGYKQTRVSKRVFTLFFYTWYTIAYTYIYIHNHKTNIQPTHAYTH